MAIERSRIWVIGHQQNRVCYLAIGALISVVIITEQKFASSIRPHMAHYVIAAAQQFCRFGGEVDVEPGVHGPASAT